LTMVDRRALGLIRIAVIVNKDVYLGIHSP